MGKRVHLYYPHEKVTNKRYWEDKTVASSGLMGV